MGDLKITKQQDIDNFMDNLKKLPLVKQIREIAKIGINLEFIYNMNFQK